VPRITLVILFLFPSLIWDQWSQLASPPRWEAPFPGVERPQTVPYRAGKEVRRPKLLHRVDPSFSAANVVGLELIINEKGEVWQARVLGDSPTYLIDAALDAVRQWRYTPTLVDGDPVPVILTVLVTFWPRPAPADPARCGSEPPRFEPIYVGGNAQASKLLRRVEPAYPQGYIGGGVIVLLVTVNEAGETYEVRAIRCPSALKQAVLAAVCQWKYSPTYLNGEAVPVVATVAIEFDLPLSK
jgi:hypothetical protein